MPGFYPEDEYDVAGFAVGVVDRSKILNMETQKPGDVLIALQSSGVHSNGYSLIRKVFTVNSQNLARHFSDLGTTLGEALLTPTKIYVNAIQALLQEVTPKSIAHITGGGFYENIPRALKKGLAAKINKNDVQVLPIFDLIAKTGKIPEHDMFNTFNMGVGMMVSVAQEDADKALRILNAAGESAYVLGELVESDEGVILK
jgi:phosphoribosylformylglycinamidine cyclo-ligase